MPSALRRSASVTVPSSVSNGISMISNTRSAPAKAEKMLFIWLVIWLMGCENDLASVMNDDSMPIVTVCPSTACAETASSAPSTVTVEYAVLLKPPITGPITPE